jgi:hypothetical protein
LSSTPSELPPWQMRRCDTSQPPVCGGGPSLPAS